MFGNKKNLPKREPAEVKISKLKPVSSSDDKSEKETKTESDSKKDKDES